MLNEHHLNSIPQIEMMSTTGKLGNVKNLEIVTALHIFCLSALSHL